jgi:hypothetical protein
MTAKPSNEDALSRDIESETRVQAVTLVLLASIQGIVRALIRTHPDPGLLKRVMENEKEQTMALLSKLPTQELALDLFPKIYRRSTLS